MVENMRYLVGSLVKYFSNYNKIKKSCFYDFFITCKYLIFSKLIFKTLIAYKRIMWIYINK